MTREERENALHCLKVMIGEEVCEECNLYGTTGTDHCEKDCVRLAIKALEQEPCEDCVSRQAVLDINANHHGQMPNHVNHQIWQEIKELPSVTSQEPKIGHWSHDGSHWKNRWICSECGYKLIDEQTRFCPDCGAKMEVENG